MQRVALCLSSRECQSQAWATCLARQMGLTVFTGLHHAPVVAILEVAEARETGHDALPGRHHLRIETDCNIGLPAGV